MCSTLLFYKLYSSDTCAIFPMYELHFSGIGCWENMKKSAELSEICGKDGKSRRLNLTFLIISMFLIIIVLLYLLELSVFLLRLLLTLWLLPGLWLVVVPVVMLVLCRCCQFRNNCFYRFHPKIPKPRTSQPKILELPKHPGPKYPRSHNTQAQNTQRAKIPNDK